MYNIIFDIGTTNITSILFDLEMGRDIDSLNKRNPQINFGKDIINRILVEKKNPGKLRKLIIDFLEETIIFFTATHNLTSDTINKVCVVGNTAMLGILLSEDMQGLIKYPFSLKNNISFDGNTKELGLSIDTDLQVLQSLGGFVGSDALSMIYYCYNLLNSQTDNYLVIDIGTNAEIAILSNNMILVASVAAGPAFEGHFLSSGMLASPGAITKINKDLSWETVDNKPALGLAGSGVLDLLVYLKNQKILDSSGVLSLTPFYLTEEIYITQDDIREVQKAKAAFLAAINTLFAKYNELTQKKMSITKVLLTGSFISSINIENLELLNFIPPLLDVKYEYLQSLALQGAKLLSYKDHRLALDNILKKIVFVNLAESIEFEKQYLESFDF